MKKTEVIIDNDKLLVRRGKETFDKAFSSIEQVKVIKPLLGRSDSFLNRIHVSNQLFEKVGAVALIYNNDTEQWMEVFCIADNELKGNSIRVTETINTEIQLKDSNVSLLVYKSLSFTKIIRQKVDQIKEDNIVISKELINEVDPDFFDNEYKLYSLYNTVTGENMIIKKKHIIVDDKLDKETIRISNLQRTFLGFEGRDYIPETVWSQLMMRCKDNKDMSRVLEVYDENTHKVIKPDQVKEKDITKVINTMLGTKLVLSPIIESVAPRSDRRSFWRVITDFYVGKSTILLTAKRPYEIDEGKDVVRMSKNSMALLGISSMDKVRITYRNKTITSRVLELEEKEAFAKTNPPMSGDVVIGLPVNLRKKLDINNVNSSVKIDRDTPFILKKSINEQIMPVLFTFLSSFLISKTAWLTAVISIALLPFVVFFNLSSKRNSRLK